MKVQSVKRSVAALLAALMVMPTSPVSAETMDELFPAIQQSQLESILEKQSDPEILKNLTGTPSNATASNAQEDVETDEVDLEDDLVIDLATASNAERAEEMISFNTGNYKVHVVSKEDFEENEIGDAYFEEDGSYTIAIPEENPYFPYEVQFEYDGVTKNEWFMNPEDTVEVNGHTFHVSAYFDDSVVTQMTLNVAGESVVVYPQEKEFTDGNGVMPNSLLHLESRDLELDLKEFDPMELSMVSIETLFAGNTEVKDTDKIMWTARSKDNYQISSKGDSINMSYDTYMGGGMTQWEMIVGEADQLAKSDVRYYINVHTTTQAEWLTSTAFVQSETGERRQTRLITDDDSASYWDPQSSERRLTVYIIADEAGSEQMFYVNLDRNKNLKEDVTYTSMRAFEGQFDSVEEITGEEITDQIFCKDMTQKDAGYKMERGGEEWITLVAYNDNGKVVGCLPILLRVRTRGNSISRHLYDSKGNSVSSRTTSKKENNYQKVVFAVTKNYSVTEPYYLKMTYTVADPTKNQYVTAAFAGLYNSISEAKAKNAEDIKDAVFGDKGYSGDFRNGAYITFFVGTDGNQEEIVHRYKYVVQGAEYVPSSSTYLHFYGLKGPDGKYISSTAFDTTDDDYNHYHTIMVGKDVDLSALAPMFSSDTKAKVYAAGGNKEEESGVSLHDFSKGSVQYTVSAEDGESKENYWLRVIKQTDGAGWIYINSFDDPNSNTETRNGITYSKREMFIDGRYEYKHDILLTNMGDKPVTKLSAEIKSDEVELDPYWTLNGKYDLSGSEDGSWSGRGDQAKLRIVPKQDMADGREVHGTLTIKSDNKPIIVLTLSGLVGDPSITTTEIPHGVKYVHYGTMIQDNNHYNFNEVTYSLVKGKLPEGMELRPNGEIYGVPKETGEFPITVEMENSYEDFKNSRAKLTLTIIENTDENVDAETDEEYYLKERVPNIGLNDTRSYNMTSVGVFDEWENLYLDGEKLEEGVDYTAESGSTRLTIRSQTLKANRELGTHTLSAEFREKDGKTLKKAAQNYKVVERTSNTSNRNNTSSSDSKDDSSSSNSSTNNNSTTSVTTDEKKGYVSAQSGIITGSGTGYARWEQSDKNWKLYYADGSMATGTKVQLADGRTVEQVLWEKVNGSYYAFGADGNVVAGWVYDYELGKWYAISEESGMCTGWYFASPDGYTYYLNSTSGEMEYGWKEIDGKWYYLNNVPADPTWNWDAETGTWVFDVTSKRKPWGALYRSEMTPDGYFVGEDGSWDGQNK